MKTLGPSPGHPSRADGRGPAQCGRDPTSGRAPHTSLFGPSTLAFSSLLQRPWGTGRGSASEHFISFHGEPCDAAGLAASARPFRLSRHDAAKPHQQAAIGTAPAFQRATLSTCFSFSFLSFKSLFPEEGPFCSGLTHSESGLEHQRWTWWFSVFHQNIPSFLVTAACSFHSSFCRLLGPRVLRALIHI